MPWDKRGNVRGPAGEPGAPAVAAVTGMLNGVETPLTLHVDQSDTDSVLRVFAGPDQVWPWIPEVVVEETVTLGAIEMVTSARFTFPNVLASGGGFAWVADEDDLTITKVDPETGAVINSVGITGGFPSGIAFGAGNLWLGGNTLRRMDGETMSISTVSGVGGFYSPIFVDGLLWGTFNASEVVVFDPVQLKVVKRIPSSALGLAFHSGRVWGLRGDKTIDVIDAKAMTVKKSIPINTTAANLVLMGGLGGEFWLGEQGLKSAIAIDIATETQGRRVNFTGDLSSVGAKHLWVTNTGLLVSAIKPEDLSVANSFTVKPQFTNSKKTGFLYTRCAEGKLWVAVYDGDIGEVVIYDALVNS